jgi:hypothetical protein
MPPRLYAFDDTFSEECNDELNSHTEHEGIGSAKKPEAELQSEVQSEEFKEDQPSLDRDECDISVEKSNSKRNPFRPLFGMVNRTNEESKESSISKIQESDLSKHCKQEFEEALSENADKENKSSKANIGLKVLAKNTSEKFSKMQNVTQQLPVQSPVFASIDVELARLSISQPINEPKYD